MKGSALVVALAKRVPFPFRLLFALDRRHLLPPAVCRHWVLRMVARELKTVPSSDQWARTVMYAECVDLVRALSPSRLAALEISPGQNRLWPELGFKSITSAVFPDFDVCSAPLPETFDLVIADQVFEHLPWPYRAGRNVRSMLKPGGHFLVTTPFLIRVHPEPLDCSRWTETGLRNLLAECGFPLDRIVTGSWGNRECVVANLSSWSRQTPARRLHNEGDFPVVVWALAQTTPAEPADADPGQPPLVSVVIPAYNAARFLAGAVESALGQTYASVEIMIVDDGSTDESLTIARGYEEQHPGVVTVLRHGGGRNRGVAASRNLALGHARGKYIAFLDADDRWGSDKLARQVEYMEAHPEIGLCYTKARIVREGEGEKWWPGVEIQGDEPPATRHETLRQVLEVSLSYAFSTVAVRADAIRAAAGFPEGIPFQSDDRIMVAKVGATRGLGFVPEILCDYRFHPDSYTTSVLKARSEAQMFLDMQVRVARWLLDQGGKVHWVEGIMREVLPESLWRALLSVRRPSMLWMAARCLLDVARLRRALPRARMAMLRHAGQCQGAATLAGRGDPPPNHP